MLPPRTLVTGLILFVHLFYGSSNLIGGPANDPGMLARYTPYDSYMAPVKKVLARLNGTGASKQRVGELMKQALAFKYVFDEPYMAPLPERTEWVQSGDCKAKSLWLCAQINDPRVHFVIGKVRPDSPMNHAWLHWFDEGRWWILDSTNYDTPVAIDSLGTADYIPLYSFSRDKAYCYRATAYMAVDRKPTAVASAEE